MDKNNTIKMKKHMEVKNWLRWYIVTNSFANEQMFFWDLRDRGWSDITERRGKDVYVYEEDGEILGFIGMDAEYIAGIFVAAGHKGQRIGH